MNLSYQSQALQDRFAAKILNYKTDGFYLDIGACDAVSTNNTYAFEWLNWKGICIEIDPQHTASYIKRRCKHIEGDATKLDYEAILKENNAPEFIDYLSLDVDAASTEVLKLLPLDKYRFGVITIEHDEYIHSGIYRDAQRDILLQAGYLLYCPDVLVPIQDDTKPDCSFEDWWIHRDIAPAQALRPRMYPNEIIQALG